MIDRRFDAVVVPAVVWVLAAAVSVGSTPVHGSSVVDSGSIATETRTESAGDPSPRTADEAPAIGSEGENRPMPGDLRSSAASTHWIVTRSGERIATKGPWKVQGRRVIFTTKNGILSSLRVSQTDLEASRIATRQALTPPPPRQERELGPPVLVLTNDDVSTVEPVAQDAGEDGGGDPEDGRPSAPTTNQALEVVSWKDVLNANQGLEFFGTLRNNGRIRARRVTLRVMLYDDTETLIGSAPATLQRAEVPGGGTVNFRASFPAGIREFRTVEFEILDGPS